MLVVGIACPPCKNQVSASLENKCGPGRLGQPLGLGMDGERSVRSHERVSRELDGVSHAGCSTPNSAAEPQAGYQRLGWGAAGATGLASYGACKYFPIGASGMIGENLRLCGPRAIRPVRRCWDAGGMGSAFRKRAGDRRNFSHCSCWCATTAASSSIWTLIFPIISRRSPTESGSRRCGWLVVGWWAEVGRWLPSSDIGRIGAWRLAKAFLGVDADPGHDRPACCSPDTYSYAQIAATKGMWVAFSNMMRALRRLWLSEGKKIRRGRSRRRGIRFWPPR
jgi:hypothetical protein